MSSQPTYLYVFRAGDAVKIGMTANPRKRYRELNRGSAIPLVMVSVSKAASYERIATLEANMHADFKSSRLQFEWFQVSDELLREKIQELAPDLYTEELPHIPDTHTRTPLPDKQVASFPAGTFDKIDALIDPETTDRTDVYREAVVAWIEKKERERAKKEKDDGR